MSGAYAEEYGVGGPSDDGVAMGVWRAFQRLDGAREAHCAEAAEKAVSPVVRALLAGLGVTAEGPDVA